MSGVKSKPVYAALSADTSGRYHVLLGVAEGAASLNRVLRELELAPPAFRQTIVVLFAGAPAPVGGAVTLFDDSKTLLTAAREVLERARMGTRLYIAGPEHFIGRALQIALPFDLNQDEIRAEHAGSAARRVHCIHCRRSTEDVKTNIVRCAGCARWLQVRDHYSRRHAAYMGVMADAEVPGEFPPLRELHP